MLYYYIFNFKRLFIDYIIRILNLSKFIREIIEPNKVGASFLSTEYFRNVPSSSEPAAGPVRLGSTNGNGGACAPPPPRPAALADPPAPACFPPFAPAAGAAPPPFSPFVVPIATRE